MKFYSLLLLGLTTLSLNLLANPEGVKIAGSSDIKLKDFHESLNKQVYFLYGAEHLKLKNYYFDIPVVYNDAVKKWIDYYLGRGRKFFETYSSRAGRYAPVMSQILDEAGMPRDLIFLAMAESGFQNKAKSYAKAVGPWQFMAYTGKKYGLNINWYIDERRDPIKSSIAASRYLKKLYTDFGSWELAAVSYNAGEGKISRAIRRYNTESLWKLRTKSYLKPEQREYVPKIMALAIIGKNLTSFGFKDIEFKKPLDFEEVMVPGNTDLFLLAEELETTFDELHVLNPELLRWQTPPDVNEYPVRVPVGKKKKFNECCKNKSLLATSYKTYRYNSRASLNAVASKFKIDLKVLAELNQVPTKKFFNAGDIIKLPFRSDQTGREQMYADLYEQPRAEVLKRRKWLSRLRRAKRRGKLIANPKVYYTVKRGDTLWGISRSLGVSLDTLIKTNYKKLRHGLIRSGDKLAIR